MKRKQIVDVIITKENEILMLERAFWPEGKLDLLGGFVDGGETIEDAAKREVKEESGLNVKLIKKLCSVDYFDREPKRAHVFIGNVIGGEITASKEGQPLWIDPKKVKLEDLAFPQLHVEVLKKYLDSQKVENH